MNRLLFTILVLSATAGVTQAQVITAYNIDNTILVDGNKYPCSDLGVDAALAALPSSVGTVIVPGCQGIARISSTVTIGNHQTLILNSGTEWQPQSPSMAMFSVKAGGTLKGLWADVSNQTSFSGQVVSLTDNYTDPTHTTVKDITCTGGPTSGPPATGSCIWLTASTGQDVAFVVVDNVHVEGFYAGLSLGTTGTGWINGNIFSDFHVSWAVLGYIFNATGGSIAGNLFSNISYQCCGQADSYGIFMEGNAQVVQNSFSGLSIWDTVSPNIPIEILTPSVTSNLFVGKFSDGTVNDPNTQNVYVATALGTGTGALAITGGVKPGSGITVVKLPSASANPGLITFVRDSKPISAEGQTCVGGSSTYALAFSNGSVWKCF
jgi:hypothetical protein